MTRTHRKRILRARLNAQLARTATARRKGPQPAATLLHDEAARIRDLPPAGTLLFRRRLAEIVASYSLAACWLESRNDPANIRRWKEIKPAKP